MAGIQFIEIVGGLVSTFLPSARPIDVPTYRRLTRERGTYAGSLPGYQPYRGNHEPPYYTPTPERARIVFARVLAVEAERRAAVTAFLQEQGLRVAPEPAAWNAIGDWIAANVEGSREPGDDRYHPYIDGYVGGRPPSSRDGQSTTTLRPLWQSLAFDLSLLLGRHMLEAWPGGRWLLVADLPGREDSSAGELLVEHEGRSVIHSPFVRISEFAHDALLLRLRVRCEITAERLGMALWRAMDPDEDPRLPPPVPPAEAFIDTLREIAKESDQVLTVPEVGELLVEHGLEDLPPLPPDLERLIPRLDAARAAKR